MKKYKKKRSAQNKTAGQLLKRLSHLNEKWLDNEKTWDFLVMLDSVSHLYQRDGQIGEVRSKVLLEKLMDMYGAMFVRDRYPQPVEISEIEGIAYENVSEDFVTGEPVREVRFTKPLKYKKQ